MMYYRVQEAKYGVHFCVAAPQEYVNTYSTCRVGAEEAGYGVYVYTWVCVCACVRVCSWREKSSVVHGHSRRNG